MTYIMPVSRQLNTDSRLHLWPKRCYCSAEAVTSPDEVQHLQVEKGGMDEAFVDVTKEAKLRVAHGACPASWHGHLHLGDVGGVITIASTTLAFVRGQA